MINITAEKQHIVLGELHNSITALIGSAFHGISHNGAQGIIHFDDFATTAQQAQASGLVAAHSPAVLLPTRDGSAVSAAAWMPYETAANVTFTIDGQVLPTAYPASAMPGGGVMASATIYQADPVLLSVSGYPVIERTI